MNDDELLIKLKEVVRPYAKNPEALDTMTVSTDFLNDLKINSSHLVDVILDIEEAFDIEIDNDSMEEMLTVKSAMKVIHEKLVEK